MKNGSRVETSPSPPQLGGGPSRGVCLDPTSFLPTVEGEDPDSRVGEIQSPPSQTSEEAKSSCCAGCATASCCTLSGPAGMKTGASRRGLKEDRPGRRPRLEGLGGGGIGESRTCTCWRISRRVEKTAAAFPRCTRVEISSFMAVRTSSGSQRESGDL